MTIDTGLRLVHDATLHTARLYREQQEAQLELLTTAVRAMDAVLDSLPDEHRATVSLDEALQFCIKARGLIG